MSDDLPDHTNYSLIKAVDESGNLVTVLCDSSGRIVSVMKGDYAGTMKTLSVDDKGRIQAVLTDPEDVFGNPNYIGAGELAARLGSIKNFEHRGQVVWMDDFEGPVLRWAPSTAGPGASVALSTARSLSDIQSAKLTAGTGSGGRAKIERQLAQVRTTKLGLELAFTTENYIDVIYVVFIIYDGTNYVEGMFKVDYVNDKIYYERPLGAWTDTGLSPQLWNSDRLFHRLKFVFDYNAQTWLRAYFDDEVADLLGNSMPVMPSASQKSIRIQVQIMGDETHNPSTYVDNVIVTQNEP